MAFASGALGLIMGVGPRAVANGTAGEFMKGLTVKLGTGLAEVDAGFLPVFLPLARRVGAMPRRVAISWADSQRLGSEPKATASLGANASPAPGRFSKAIGMNRKEFGDLFIVAGDIRQEVFELAGQHLDPQSGRLDDGRVLR